MECVCEEPEWVRRPNAQRSVRRVSVDRRRRRRRPGNLGHQGGREKEAERKRFWMLDGKPEQKLIDVMISRMSWS